MANINLSEAFAVARFQPFGGINGQPKDREGCVLSDIKNFRITESGALEKRSGFSELLTLPGIPRAIIAVSENEMFVLIDGQIYRSSVTSTLSTSVSTVSNSVGDASFFKYGGDIYLLDGNELYRFDGSVFSPAEGYAPLYFKDAGTDTLSPVHEPLNLISNRYRVSYRIGDTVPSNIPLPFAAGSIDRVLRNGADSDLAKYTLHSSGGYVEIASSALSPKDVVEFSVTMLSHPFERVSLTGSTRAVTFGAGKNSHAESSVAFYGGGNGRSVFTTRPVESAEYLKVKKTYGDASTLYVTVNDMATLDGMITAAAPCGPSLAVFLDGSAYLAEENSGFGTKLICMSKAHGCAVKDGIITFESSPITMSDTGIFLWHPHEVYDGEYTAECISLPICHLMPTHTISGFIYYRRSKNEIWCQAGTDRIMVRNTVTGDWYTYEGFFPRFILELGGRTAFVTDRTLYGFSDTVPVDANRRISASISVSLIHFGDFTRRKRLSRAILLCSKGSTFELTVIDSTGRVTDTELSDDGSEVTGYIEKRLPTKRARHYSFTLSTSDVKKTSVDALILTAVK